MVDNPNVNYYKPSFGSLTGFDSANIPTGTPNLPEFGWSVSQLVDFLRNQTDVNFPSTDWMTWFENSILNHVNNFNNPHNVTLDQIAASFVEGILGNIVPGTPPDIPPFFSFDASQSLPIGDIFPATYSTTNLYRMTESGFIVDPSTETGVLGTDYVTNNPGIPLFSSLTNIAAGTWATDPSSSVNTVFTPLSNQDTNYPFTFYQLSEKATLGEFGITIPATEDLATTYTATFFIMPAPTGGVLYISQPTDTDNLMTVNLTDGSYTITGTDIAGKTFVYSNGLIRVSFSFTSGNPTPDNAIQIVHLNTGDVSPTRTGIQGRQIFAIAQPFVTKSAVNQPTMIDPTKPASTSNFALNMSAIPVPATLPSVIVTLSLDVYPLLHTATLTDTEVFSFDTLSITRDYANLYVNVSNSRIFSSPILEGNNILTISYSPTKIILKDLSNPRVTVTGTYPALQTNAITAGLFEGYIKDIALYAMVDNNQCVEFLTNA